jgi:hypothetical protein
MKNKLQRIAKVVLCCLLLIALSCEKDNAFSEQDVKMIEAKTWFDKYEANGINYELFQNLKYDWNGASITKSEDGTETIIVPVVELNEDKKEIWSQKLFLYKSDTGNYKALMFEIYPNKDAQPSSQSIDGGDFNGYMTSWDLKTGFVRAAKFKNNQVIEIGDAQVISVDKAMTNKAPAIAPCYEDGCQLGPGGNPIQLRPVIVTGPSNGTPVVYTPRNPVTGGGGDSGGFTSPGGGGSGGSTTNPADSPPPSCESFNFIADGSLWQVAMVRNINFRVLGLSPSGVEILHVLSYPQAVYFGTPTNVQVGNTNITAGIAANTSARVLQQSMQEVVDKYGGTDVSDLILDRYFRERLIHNYPLFVPGGRVNFNSTSNIPATNYKANYFRAGDCR